jgi:putative membrane protein
MLVFFLTTLVTALSLLVVDLVVPGVNLATFAAAVLAALVIGLVNGTIKPVLSFLSLPLTFITFGAFALVVNGLCFWLASLFVPGFSVHGPLAFLLAPVVLSVAATAINGYFDKNGVGLPFLQGKKDKALESE